MGDVFFPRYDKRYFTAVSFHTSSFCLAEKMSPQKKRQKKGESSQRRSPVYIPRWTDDKSCLNTHSIDSLYCLGTGALHFKLHQIWKSATPSTTHAQNMNIHPQAFCILQTREGAATKMEKQTETRTHAHKEKKLKCKRTCVECVQSYAIRPDQTLLAGGHLCPTPDCVWQHTLVHKTQLKVRIKSFNRT